MKETVDNIRSESLQNERPVWILDPADPARCRQIVVFLDGEAYREHMDAVATIQRLQGVIADAWFVFVSMFNRDARWVELPCHPPFARFIAEELMTWLRERHPATVAATDRTLVGLSYSGLAAAYVAKEFPGVFQKVVSQSGSFWSGEGRLADEYRALTKPVPTEFYLEVGTRETQENVRHKEDVLQRISQLAGVRDFRDALRERGHRVTYREFEGAHEHQAWKKTLPDALRWALPLDSGRSAEGSTA